MLICDHGGASDKVEPMALSDDYLEFVRDQMSSFGEFTIRKMFGGAGLYKDGRMFALVSPDNKLFFKVDEDNLGDYESAGSGPFVPPFKTKRAMAMPYFEVPADVIEDRDEVARWARKAHEVAVKGK
jgi:DNA transformation protein